MEIEIERVIHMDASDISVMEEVMDGDIEDLLYLPVPPVERLGKKKRVPKSTKTVTILDAGDKQKRKYTKRTPTIPTPEPEAMEVVSEPLKLDIVYEALQEIEGKEEEEEEEKENVLPPPTQAVTSQWNTELLFKNMRAYYHNPVVYIFHMGKGQGTKCADGVVDFVHKLETYLIDRHVESMTVFATEKYENPGINNAYVTQDYHIKWDHHYGNRAGVGILLYEAPHESVEEFYKVLCDFKMSGSETVVSPSYFLEKLYMSKGSPIRDRIFSTLHSVEKY